MAEVLLFHHAQGQTTGFLAFADELRAAGNVVHAPDLYDGKTFTDLKRVSGTRRRLASGRSASAGRLAADGLPKQLVYAGFSLGAMPAQMLAQTRPGAKGALLFSAAFPASEFGGSWPQGVPLQIHMMEGDEWAMEDLPRRVSSSRRSTVRSCSCTRARDICSPTTVCRTTTRAPRGCSSNASSRS
jgi:Dienelactone hydrolase and related enzymes